MDDRRDSADLFISYSTEDRDVVRELVKVLEDREWSVWWDRDIDVGTEFATVIEKELASSRCVIALWSQYSVASPWVRSEAQEGLQRGNLIPVLLDEATPPLPFRALETANLVGWPNQARALELDKLLASIEFCLSNPEGFQKGPERPVKNRTDPTLSRRVADRVMTQLQEIGTTPSVDTQLVFERHVADLAISIAGSDDSLAALRSFTANLAQLWHATVAYIFAGNEQLAILDVVGVNEPNSLIHDITSDIRLDTEETLNAELLETNATWRLCVGNKAGPRMVWLGKTASEGPSKSQVERLTQLINILVRIR